MGGGAGEMTNGERIQTILDVDRDCTEVHGENGTMTFTVTQDFWNAEYQEPTPKNDLGVDAVSRQAVLDLIADYDLSMGQVVKAVHALPSVTPQEPQSFKWCTDCREYDQEKHCCHRYSKVIRDTVAEIGQEPKTGQMTNSEWIEFLSKQFDISRTSAKEMLHGMMSVKKEDNFKKQFSGRK